jgi:hypothetical protein
LILFSFWFYFHFYFHFDFIFILILFSILFYFHFDLIFILFSFWFWFYLNLRFYFILFILNNNKKMNDSDRSPYRSSEKVFYFKKSIQFASHSSTLLLRIRRSFSYKLTFSQISVLHDHLSKCLNYYLVFDNGLWLELAHMTFNLPSRVLTLANEHFCTVLPFFLIA